MGNSQMFYIPIVYFDITPPHPLPHYPPQGEDNNSLGALQMGKGEGGTKLSPRLRSEVISLGFTFSKPLCQVSLVWFHLVGS